MKHNSKLKRSNNAHSRLQRKYSQLGGRKAIVRENYHADVRAEQEVRGRILTKDEKKKIFSYNEKRSRGEW